jgi:hypothetical protein
VKGYPGGLSPSCWLIRGRGPIVLAQALLVARPQSDFGLARAVRVQLVGHQRIARRLAPLAVCASISLLRRCRAVVASQIEKLAFVVDRAPPARYQHGQVSGVGEFRPCVLLEPDVIDSHIICSHCSTALIRLCSIYEGPPVAG